MAGPRQNNSQEFITNLSKKIEKMMDTAEQYNEDIVTFLSSMDKTQKGVVSVELKKQTLTLDKIHTSINKWNEKLTSVLKESVDKTNQYGIQLSANKNESSKTQLAIENQTLILSEIKQHLLKFDKFQEEKIKSEKVEEGKLKSGLGRIIEISNKTNKELNAQTLVLGEIKKSLNVSSIKSEEAFKKSEKVEEGKSKAVLGKIIEIFDKTNKELNAQTLVLGEIKKSLDASSIKSTEIFTKSKAEETKSKAGLREIIEIFGKTNKELNYQTLILGEIKQFLLNSGKSLDEKSKTEKAEKTKSNLGLGRIIELFDMSNKELYSQTLVLGEIKKSLDASSIKSEETFKKSKVEDGKSNLKISKLVDIESLSGSELKEQTGLLKEIKDLFTTSQKKMDAGEKDSGEQTKILKEIQSSSIDWRVSFIKDLNDITNTALNKNLEWHEKQYGVLISIEKKLGNQSVASSGGGSGKSFVDSLKDLPGVLFSLLKALAFAGLLSDLIVDGAKSIGQSIVEIFNSVVTIGLAKALEGVAIIRLLSESRLDKVATLLSSISDLGLSVVANTWILVKSLEILFTLGASVKPLDVLMTFGILAVLSSPVAKDAFLFFKNTLTYFVEGIEKVKISTVLRSFLFGASIAVLFGTLSSIDLKTAIYSLGLLKLMNYLKIGEIINSISEPLNKVSLFMPLRAYSLSLSSKILLGMSEGLSIQTALLSIGYYKLLSLAGLSELTSSISQAIGFSFTNKLVNRSKSLVESSRILLSLGDQKRSELNPNPVSMNTAYLSVTMYKLLSKAGLDEISKALSSSIGFFAIFQKDALVKRATSLKKSTLILLGVSEEIPMPTALKSLLIYTLLGYGVPKLVDAFKSAGLWAPIVLLGVSIISRSVRKMTSALNDSNKSAGQTLAAGAFLIMLSFSIGTIIMLSTVAALAFPVILLGTFAISFMINKLSKIMIKANSLPKSQAGALDKILGVATVITVLLSIVQVINQESKGLVNGLKNALVFSVTLGALIGIVILTSKIAKDLNISPIQTIGYALGTLVNSVSVVVLSKAAENTGQSLKAVAIFSIAMITTIGITLLVAKVAKNMNLSPVQMIATSVSILINSLSALIISKALAEPQKSLKDVFIFGIMTAMISANVLLFSKAGEKLSITKMIGLIVMLGALVLATKLVLSFAEGLGMKSLKEVLIFNLITLSIVYGAIFASKKMDAELGKVIKAVISIVLWVAAMSLVALAIKFILNNITIMDVVKLGLIVLGLSFVFNRVSKKSDEIRKGVIAVALMSLGILAIIPAMLLFKSTGLSGLDALGVGILILALSYSMKKVGKDWKDILKGALAIGVASIGIAMLVPGLMIFKLSGFGVLDAIALSLVLVGVAWSFSYVGERWKDVLKGSAMMIPIAIGIALLSIGLMIFKVTGFGLMDTLTVTLTIIGLGIAFWIIGKGWDTILLGSLAVLGMSIAIGILSIALFFYKQSKFELQDGLTLALTVLGLGIVFWVVGQGWKTILKGAAAIAGLGAAIWVLSHGMKVWSKINVKFKDIATLAGTIAMFGIEFGIAGNFYKDILKGAAAIAGLGAALWVVGHGMKVWTSAKVKMSDVKILGLTIGMLAVEFALVGAYEAGLMTGIPLTITMGSLAIAGLGASLWVVSQGMKAWTSAKVKMSDVKTLGATIAILGVEFAAAGFASPLILSGSFALGAASIPLLAITGALKVFAISKFTKADGDNLSYALQSVIDGFLGGKMPGGFLAGLSYAAKSAARIALMIPAIPVIMLAGAALIPITKSILIFKNSGFNKEDGSNLEYMVSSVIKGFGLLGDKKRQKQLGVSFDNDSIKSSVGILSGAGKVLSGLAEGIRSWANLEIVEWDIINPGTSKAKFVISGKRKLNKSDFENAAYGMSQVINAVGEPFAKLGRLQKGQLTGDPYLDRVYSGNFISEGIKSLTGIGSIMSSLAQGVRDFSNMSFTEYEVVNAGTDKAKLVPKVKRKLSDTEIAGAGKNIGKILSVVGYEFAKIGRKEANTEGKQWPWSGGWVSKGIDALEGISEILSAVTKGVVSMVYNEIPTFELINGGTSKAKLVPGKSIKVTDSDLEKASRNINKILSIIAYEFSKIGRNESNTEGAFSGGWVTKGVKSLSGISGILKSVVENVSNMAYGSFQSMELVNAGTPNAKLVPGTPIKFTPKVLIDAGKTIGNILNAIGNSFVHFGYYISKNRESFDISIESVSKISEPIKSMIEFTNEFLKIKDPLKISDNIKKFFETINSIFSKNSKNSLDSISKNIELYTKNMINLGESASAITKFSLSVAVFEKLKNPKVAANDISAFISTINANFDVTKNRNLKTTMDNMGMFTTGITNIAKKADPLEKAAKNMDRIQKSMKLMKESVNSMDLKKLTLTDAMLRSMAILSKNPEAMAKTIEKSLNASFAALIAAIKSNLPAKAANNTVNNTVDSPTKTVTTNKGDGDKKDDNKDNKKESGNKSKTGFKDDSNIFTMTAKNQDMYQAMVEALNDVVIRTVAVGSNDYSRK